MGGGGAAAKPKKSVEIIVVGRGEGYSDSWIPILDAWVLIEPRDSCAFWHDGIRNIRLQLQLQLQFRAHRAS